MSYQSRRPSRTRVPRGLGGLLDDLINFSSGGTQQNLDQVCIQAAPSDPQVAARTAQITDLEQNWNPTGFYTADQLGQALGFTMRMTGAISEALGAAITAPELDAHRARLQGALDDVQRAIGVGGFGVDPLGPYAAAAANVRAQVGGDGVIEAKGFKRTVLNVMRKVRDATEVLVAVNCARPNLLFAAMGAAVSAFTALYDFLKSLVQLVLDAAVAVAKIPDAVSDLFTYAKWALIIGGGYWIATKAGVVPEKYDPLKLGR